MGENLAERSVALTAPYIKVPPPNVIEAVVVRAPAYPEYRMPALMLVGPVKVLPACVTAPFPGVLMALTRYRLEVALFWIRPVTLVLILASMRTPPSPVPELVTVPMLLTLI